MAAPLTTTYRPRGEVSLRLTLGSLAQGRTDPTFQRDGSGIWMTMATPAGAATLRVRALRSDIEAAAWGPGAAEAIAQVPALCGADDDDDGFDPSRHPVVADRKSVV